MINRLPVLLALGLGCPMQAPALDHVVLRRDGTQVQVDGRLVLTAQDGGVLLLARDGVLWAVEPKDLVRQTSDEVSFRAMTPQELASQVLGQLPAGFDTHQTTHYVIVYGTSRAYAQWCGSLFERLYMAFTNFWSRRGFDLREPEFPLVAIVFADKGSYVRFARAEVGEAAEAMIGYYSLQTNRMVMYDLTGVEAAGPAGRGNSSAQISRILAQPEAERTVATVVHEATHQIAFNCGLHTRLSDCPLWFSEGIATYFETPDLTSAKGWRNIGAVNRPRLTQFQQYLERRPADSLVTLIGDDQRFRDTKQSLDAYAESWALTYFLLRQYPKHYLAYLKMLSAKKPMIWDEPAARLAQFKEAFGDDLKRLDAELVRYMARVR